MFTIEKGIPLPARHAAVNYPFAQLEVGDSFLVPIDFDATVPEKVVAAKRLMRGIASAQQAAAKDTGLKFPTRRVEGGVRIWRLS